MMDALLSPLGLALAFVWNVAVLASVQLTVRLIMAFSVRKTLVGALVLTCVTVPVSLAYYTWFHHTLALLPVAMILVGAAGFVIADRVLGFRRQRSTITAAIGIGLLSAPWGAFLVRAAG
ncbi:MAG: LrgB family protein [Chloroflexi bacterium]|nr:LrgB family protein [Chloroflexota bacterium]